MSKAHRPDPLLDPPHPKYEKVTAAQPGQELASACTERVPHCECLCPHGQVRDLNSGTFGFVQLCKDKITGELLAIKFIERGEKASHRIGSGGCQNGSAM